MNKRDLIDAIADASGHPKHVVTEVMASLLDLVREAVIAGDKVRLVGFGTFELAHKSAYTGRNPSTGDPVPVAESWKPRMKPSDAWTAQATAKQSGGAA